MTWLPIVDYVLLWLWWLIFGSFGSVLLTRCEHGLSWNIVRSILVGRSQCPHCKAILGPKELVPLFSRLSQSGKCSSCDHPIPVFYPLCEIIALGGSLVFGYRGITAGLGWGSLLLAAIGSFLFLLAYWDFTTWYLHDILWFVTICLWFVFFLLFPVWWSMQGLAFAVLLLWCMLVLYVLAGLYGGWKETRKRWSWNEWLGEWDVRFILAFAPLVGVLPLSHNPFFLLSIWLLAAGSIWLLQLLLLRLYAGHQNETIHFFPPMLTAFLILFLL